MSFEQAMLDPAKCYDTPADLLNDTRLSREEKIKVLRCWEFDARESEVAEEENMGGGRSTPLSEVLDALHKLGETSTSVDAPTKQGGE
ncbi:hypothetical protein ACQUQP_08650 [Marinobacterium sp. YM272]|uniref:hypothetical protein n=1 Tax=Marinobacterium sp. YM272 TaxID=3421654 RepID=UPI003D7FE123